MTRCANSTSCKNVHISPGLDALASSPKLTATEVVSKSSLVEVSVRGVSFAIRILSGRRHNPKIERSAKVEELVYETTVKRLRRMYCRLR